MPELPNPTILITGAAAVVAILLYFHEYYLRRKDSLDQRKISQETKQKAAQLINAAEEAESELLSKGNWATQKLAEEFESRLEGLIQTSQNSISVSQDQLIKFMKDLQKRSADFEEASRSSTEAKINQIFERLESKLSDFLIQTEQKTTSSIELELKSTRQLIETYKNQQLKLIDENIIAMMEQTLTLVLAKKLSLKDQLDLVYEALAKAKVEKFIV